MARRLIFLGSDFEKMAATPELWSGRLGIRPVRQASTI